MKIIALTGGVASGKNFIADIFAKNFNCKIFDADQETHNLLQQDKEVLSEVLWYFPSCVIDNKIDRKKLGTQVFHNKEKLLTLEKILHPKVKNNYNQFLTLAKEAQTDYLILNIPLLIEKGNYRYDSLIAIITDKKIRQERYVKRELLKDSSQNQEELIVKFNNIVANQASDLQRTAIAHFVLDGGLPAQELTDKIKRIVSNL